MVGAAPGFNLSGRIPVDGTLISLLLPSILINVICFPAGYIVTFYKYRDPIGDDDLEVQSGATANYYWMMLQYIPVIVTLAFATSMVYAGRVVADVFGEDSDKDELEKMEKLKKKAQEDGTSTPAPPTPRAEPKPTEEESAEAIAAAEAKARRRPPTMKDLRETFKKIDTNRNGTLSKEEVCQVIEKFQLGYDVDKLMEKADLDGDGSIDFNEFVQAGTEWFGLTDKVMAESQHERAIDRVTPTSRYEIAQWLLLLLFMTEILAVGNFSDPDYPLWNEEMRAFVVGFIFLGLVLIVFAVFTLRNLRVTMVRREGIKTIEYVAQFLGRITVVLIIQHLCFFFVGIAATNSVPAFQPVAFSLISVREDSPPCSLLTADYLINNCTAMLDLYLMGPIGANHYECGTDHPWHGYTSAYNACGGVTTAITLRNMGYSAVMISFNAFLYVLLKECTRDISRVAMSKMTRGKSDTRTSIIFSLTGLALACNPLFFTFMLLSATNIMKSNLATLLTLGFFFNMICWFVVGLLLNVEFFLAKIKSEAEYDVMISYRVWSDAGLAQDLYRKLTLAGLRVYLDKFCLKDGEDFEKGFLSGLANSNVYVLLFSLDGMEKISTLQADTPACDNVLLEMRMARELEVRREHLYRIYPLLLGKYERAGQFKAFDFGRCYGIQWPSVECKAVEDKVVEKLAELESKSSKSMGLGKQTTGDIKENMGWFLKKQSLVSLDIDYDRVLDIAVGRIAKISDEVKAEKDAGGSLNEMMDMILPKKSTYKPGEKVYVHSKKFSDGTRLRATASAATEEDFSQQVVMNNARVKILETKNVKGERGIFPYAKVAKLTDPSVEGWILQQNLTRRQGKEGKVGVIQYAVGVTPGKVAPNRAHVAPAPGTDESAAGAVPPPEEAKVPEASEAKVAEASGTPADVGAPQPAEVVDFDAQTPRENTTDL